MATGTPATKLLKSAGIEFKEHEYSHDPNSTSFGLEAAEKLGVDPNRVFKTLIANVDENFAVAIVSVKTDDKLRVAPSPSLFADLKALLGAACLEAPVLQTS